MNDAMMKLKAAAYQLAAEKGWREAIDALQQLAREIQDEQWKGPSNQ